ncbi:MAG TPA: TlpA disulfide reductase family protein [Candidatus Binatia bacterium]|nr:TlpA disulfide reductase family protein [Candidatus Binatia bacterium]
MIIATRKEETFKRRFLSWTSLTASCVTAMALMVNSSWAQHIHPAPQSAAPVIGAAAIPFELKTLEGKSAGLETFRGKPLVINFFASWCDPCREEMPLINELSAKAGGGYQVLGIAVEDTRAAVIEYAKEAKLAFPIALDLNSTVKRAYRIFGPPATFFVDGQGIIRDVVLGPISQERIREAMKRSGVVK